MTIIFVLLMLIFLPYLIGLFARVASTAICSSNKPPIFLFHSVTTVKSLDRSHIQAKTLESFSHYLIQNDFKTCTAFETVQKMQSHNRIDQNTVTLLFDDGFENFYTHAFPILQEFDLKASVFPVVDCLGDSMVFDVYKPKPCLTKEQLTHIAKAGFEIGSHTMTHPDLTLISNKQLQYELAQSKDFLESITNNPIHTISFPFGSWNHRVWDFAQECGYTAAVAYRKHRIASKSILSARGVYAFDSIEDLQSKLHNRGFSNSLAREIIMPHFAKGTALWKFRKEYTLFT